MPNDIRIEKIISALILGQLGPTLDRKILNLEVFQLY